MLHAILIISPDAHQALVLAKKLSQSDLTPQPDVCIIEAEPSISIQKVKKIEKFLSQKPFQAKQKIVFIPQAELLTLPAQNALLKILEEPPAHSLIILVSSHQNQLLPTIISRCEIHPLIFNSSLDPEFMTLQNNIYSAISNQSIGQKINFISQYSGSKISAIEFCTNQLKYLRYLMLTKKQFVLLPIIKALTQAITRLNQNLNPKLVLENLILAAYKPSRSNLEG
ncbi:MAG: hypothetical protein U0946_05545 [Patescibacteria group bacterium]|nr:hypothetical protein [Patescibacteria group bacterium]